MMSAMDTGARHTTDRFQFENIWVADPGINDIISSAWRAASGPHLASNLLMKIKKCSSELQRWNVEHFGNVNLGVCELEAQLAQAREINQRKEILGNIREWRKHEEILWWQWARSNHLKYGDSNTWWPSHNEEG